jgi:hypothetical protein
VSRRTAREYVFAAEAAALLAVMRIAIAVVPFRTTARLLGLTPGPAQRKLGGTEPAQVELVGWAVRAAARRVPWRGSCMTQALTASVLLRQMRLPATLHLGVANDRASASMVAHAWVEIGSKVVVGGEGHQRFTSVATYH